MSRFQQTNGDDYPDAASKLIKHATVLQTNSCFDSSAYLSGYIVECCLKTFAQLEGKRVPIREHDLNILSNDALRLAALPSTKTAKYAAALFHPIRLLGLGGWTVNIRYKAEGSISSITATEWLQDAQNLYNHSIVPMKLDGQF